MLCHRFKHLCSRHNDLSVLIALGDDHLLDSRELLERYLYTHISTGNHDSICNLKNRIEIVDTASVLNLRNDLYLLAPGMLIDL